MEQFRQPVPTRPLPPASADNPIDPPCNNCGCPLIPKNGWLAFGGYLYCLRPGCMMEAMDHIGQMQRVIADALEDWKNMGGRA